MSSPHTTPPPTIPSEVLAHPTFQPAWIQRLLRNPENEWTLQIPGPHKSSSASTSKNTSTSIPSATSKSASASNALFEKTLRQEDCILAHIIFDRPRSRGTTHPHPAASNSSNSATTTAAASATAAKPNPNPNPSTSAVKTRTQTEERWLLSLGSGIDGATGRAHGGFNALALDQISGSVSYQTRDSSREIRTMRRHTVESHIIAPPATATMTITYRNPVPTPCVVLLRAWVEEVSGRKVWVRGVMEGVRGVGDGDGAGDGDGERVVYCESRALFVHAREGEL